MTDPGAQPQLSTEDVQDILQVTRALAAPFDLSTMLDEVSAAARRVLHAERSSVWLHDPTTGELVLEVGSGLQDVRIKADTGLLGACLRERRPINVPDCYADPRFDRSMDAKTGFRTRCSLTVPLVGHGGDLVGAMQLLNRHDGVFEAADVALAEALAAQCAVALSRARLMEAMLQGQKLQRELELARVVQLSTLPAAMPQLEGYDVFGSFRPADLTGGDSFDLALEGGSLLVMLADATGHGIAPALDVTRMHAMLRTALGMGAGLNQAVVQINNQLAQTLPDDRFITAFIGLLDPAAHRLTYHSAGQAPLLLYRAASRGFEWLDITSFPLAAMPLARLRDPVSVQLEPGDVLVLASDGIYEYHDGQGRQFGREAVAALVGAQTGASMAKLSQRLLEAVAAHAAGAPQEDDITMVLVRRSDRGASAGQKFEREIETLEPIFEFTGQFRQDHGVPEGVMGTADFVIEELFTNMVKYSTMSRADVWIALTRVPGGVEVEMIDYDVDAFDVTAAPDAEVARPMEQRNPGGLGLHLIRRLVDWMTYEYDSNKREGRVVFRKTDAP